jgi:hypothetical protein
MLASRRINDTFCFSIRRLLLVVAVLALLLSVTRPLGTLGFVMAVLIGIPLSALLLVARIRHARSIIRSLIFSVLGIFIGLMFCPAVSPPYENGDEFRYMIPGAIIGWFIGILSQRKNPHGEQAPATATTDDDDHKA